MSHESDSLHTWETLVTFETQSISVTTPPLPLMIFISCFLLCSLKNQLKKINELFS